jgi:acylglycerol lipase
MVGHSMGGAETLHFAAHGPASTRAQLRGYMVYGPFVALHPRTRPSSFTVKAGRLAGKLLPQFHMYQPLDETLISLDPAVGKRFKADALCHDTGTLEGLAGMLDRGIQMAQGNVVVQDEGEHKWAVWVSHGTDDQICDYAATAKWYERDCRVQDKTIRPWQGAYHRLHEDPEPTKSEFESEMIKWILDRP